MGIMGPAAVLEIKGPLRGDQVIFVFIGELPWKDSMLHFDEAWH